LGGPLWRNGNGRHAFGIGGFSGLARSTLAGLLLSLAGGHLRGQVPRLLFFA
jgi:hypothetical protein